MKSTLELLSNKEREALARLYEMDGYKALVKLCDFEIVALGKDALEATDMNVLGILRGKALMAKHLPKTIRGEYKRLNKEG